VLCYLNDILVGGATDAEHICNLGDVLQRLLDHGIKVQNSKCVFLSKSVEYLGHTIDGKGLHMSHKIVVAIQKAPPFMNAQEIKSFLGLLHFYRKFTSLLCYTH